MGIVFKRAYVMEFIIGYTLKLNSDNVKLLYSQLPLNELNAGLIIADPMTESRRDSAYVPFWSSSKELGS